MKISRDGLLPQLEPEGWGEPLLVRVGGAKRIIQQSSFPMQAVTMVNASISAWATSAALRGFFLNDVMLFAATVGFGLTAWMVAYFTAILPGEQAWGQGQSQRTERSPLKQDTEEIIRRLDAQTPTVIVPECSECERPGQPGTHKGMDVVECPDCGDILFRGVDA